MLTDEERKRITLAVHNDKDRGHGFTVDAETLDEVIESIVRAASAQELRDALTATMKCRCSEECQIMRPVFIAHMKEWLRDRANHIESSQPN